jgi:hypothetical protein
MWRVLALKAAFSSARAWKRYMAGRLDAIEKWHFGGIKFPL